MKNNMLKLNDDKTDVLYIASPHFKKQLQSPVFAVDKTTVNASVSARNIGVIFDESLNMSEHISSVCKTCYLHLRNIGSIRKYLTQDACTKLVHSLVTSRIDYCNSLLVGLPSSSLQRLQRMLNTAARIVSLLPKHHHITPVLHSLHWLPVEQRIKYKVLLFVFKSLHQSAPSYLCELISQYQPSRTLRSADQMSLCVPKSNTKYGDRAFAICGPSFWNNLPVSLRQSQSIDAFKRDLKTFLFCEAFRS